MAWRFTFSSGIVSWFSALIVNPVYRNKGIGVEIQNHILEYCKTKGYKEIYLYTDLVGYYEKNDWIKFDIGYEYSGTEVCIYKHTL
ncbi:GNAT family N-acetyltransferase [uncultured Clostridium sp.]|uniref:GNAT family N-acetyltransferase n=1 Tax=uncultured Clostridium sp. TaxID=59620 RepID=UPI0025F3E8D5|nr:GNAT family N-acetyltransferase [uncultured Clostridium sp.]